MATIYVRVQPRKKIERFFRCGIGFTKDWQRIEADKATAERLEAEQMLEVSVTKPDDYQEPTAGDSAGTDGSGSTGTGTSGAATNGKGDQSPADPQERLAAIRTAIDSLDKDDASLWTGGGKPKTEAIAAVLGWAVTAAERDAAQAQA